MRRPASNSILLTLPALVLSLPGLFAGEPLVREKPALPTAEEILKSYLERVEDRDDDEVLSRYAFESFTVIEELDKAGAVKERSEYRHDLFPVEDALFARLVEKDGKALSPKESRKESRREAKFRRKRKQARLKPKKKKKKTDDGVEINQALFDRFNWEVLDVEEINGRAAYVLAFEPKSGKLPEKRRFDRALNKTVGTIWVDAEEREVARIRIHLTAEVKFWGGLLGRISTFVLDFEQLRTDAGDWVPSREKVYFRARVLFRNIHRRTERTSRGYRRSPPKTQTATTEPQ